MSSIEEYGVAKNTEGNNSFSLKTSRSDSIKVLCVVDYYLPGFKGGGPIRTIANMRSLFSGKVDISIFTRDRDLGSNEPYDSVQSDAWLYTEDGPIYYASPRRFGYAGLREAVSESGCDFHLIYLNSFFGFSSSIQHLFRLKLASVKIPVLLAPRGEFSAGALAIKPVKKYCFLNFSKIFHFYDNVIWHASTEVEKKDILSQFPNAKNRIYVAEDPIQVDIQCTRVTATQVSQQGCVRLGFISRISPMKNLDGLLGILNSVDAEVILDIFGPIEDVAYWKSCQRLIEAMPTNVTVTYCGSLSPEQVSLVFADYDLFAFPTHGENFGHVIFEALRAGTPVILSDQTSWKVDAAGAVKVVPLADLSGWREQLQVFANRSPGEKIELRIAARAYAEAFSRDSGIIEKNLHMFREAALTTSS